MNKTILAGKDATLEEAIERMQRALSENGFDIVEHSWGNPAPHIWWVHIRDAQNPMCFTNGKGGTKLAALASALGEFIERLSCNYFFADYHLGNHLHEFDFVHYPNERWFDTLSGSLNENCPDGMLNDELAQFYDPDNELFLNSLHDINAGIDKRGICTIPFECQRTHTITYFPVNIIANLYVSNGMSAGNTKMEARTQALSEIFERWVKNIIISEGISLPVIPEDVLSKYASIKENIDDIRSQGFVVKIFDASLGGKYPVIGAALINPADSGCLTSFGAHPNFEVALERTVTEILQGRELKSLGSFPAPSFDDDWIADPHNIETHFIDSTGSVSWNLFSENNDYEFKHWNFEGNTADQYNYLLNLLHDMADVYIADYDYLGVYACRIIVPSISEIYPIDELVRYNNNIGNEIRNKIVTIPDNQNQEHYAAVLDWLDENNLDDGERVCQVLGLSVESMNQWHDVRLGELRCYLHLGRQEWQEALDMTSWVLTFSAKDMPLDKKRFFECLNTLLTIEQDETLKSEDFVHIHREVFGNKTYDKAIKHIDGTTNFFDIVACELLPFEKHQLWLSRYKSWQRVKARLA